jgi:hypothetical protein
VNRNGRYEAWILTARARQMVLGEGEVAALPDEEPDAIEVDGQAVEDVPAGGEAENGKGKFYPSMGKKYPSRSSSLTTHDHVVDQPSETTTTTTTTDGEGKKLPVAAETALDLLQGTGIPAHTKRRTGARDAIDAALAGGWSGEEIAAAVRGWLAYCESDRGKGIRHAGFYTASRVAKREPAPSPPATRGRNREADAKNYIQAAYDRLYRR